MMLHRVADGFDSARLFRVDRQMGRRCRSGHDQFADFGLARGTIAVLMALSMFPALTRGEIIDRVLAVVDGAVITQSDVTAAMDLGLVPRATTGDATAAALTRLIDRQLMLAELERYAPSEPAADAVEREVQNVRARFPSAGAYASALAQVGLDEQQVRRTLSDDLRLKAYLDQRFTIPPPSEEEVREYYQEHADAFTRNGQVQSLSAVRSQIEQALTEMRRAMLVEDWAGSLRRRAVVANLYFTRQ
jgi:hypothetical protein